MSRENPRLKSRPQFPNKGFNKRFTGGPAPSFAKYKRKFVPEQKAFGSLQEGQGYALKRKQKTQHEYNKLLRKERKRRQGPTQLPTEEYPEHLRHLYVAEKERMEEEERANQLKRRQGRPTDRHEEKEMQLDVPSTEQSTEICAVTEKNDETLAGVDVAASPSVQTQQPVQTKSSPSKAPLSKKKQNMSSYQQTKLEYERKKEERERKREAFLKDKAEREEALKRYSEKKKATYQLLKKKTKKGQPNLNLQMELLLEKIQAQRK